MNVESKNSAMNHLYLSQRLIRLETQVKEMKISNIDLLKDALNKYKETGRKLEEKIKKNHSFKN